MRFFYSNAEPFLIRFIRRINRNIIPTIKSKIAAAFTLPIADTKKEIKSEA